MTSDLKLRITGALAVAAMLATPPAVTARADDELALARDAATAAPSLPLGPSDLTETRTTTTLQRGVTLTTIVRGAADPASVWTVEVSIPAGETSPDPDAPPKALSDRTSADRLADRLRAAAFDPRVEEVVTPSTADYAGGSLGWRVRVGRLPDKAAADALRVRLVAAGFAGASLFTGWDGSPTDRGPWRLQVLTIDPDAFTGSLLASYGPRHREPRDHERAEPGSWSHRRRERGLLRSTRLRVHRGIPQESGSTAEGCSARRSATVRRWSSAATRGTPGLSACSGSAPSRGAPTRG